MTIAGLMQQRVRIVAPDTTLAEALVSLVAAESPALPVVARDGMLVGIVEDIDLIAPETDIGNAATSLDCFEDGLVRDIMTPPTCTISADATVRDAARQLIQSKGDQLFVTRDGRLVGLISTMDIVRAVAEGRI